MVLVGVTEGWTVADRIAASGIPVIASAVNDLPSSFEQLAATQSNIGRMRNAGVNVAIGMIDDNDSRYLFNQRQYAGNLVALASVPGATGVSWGEAWAMITSKPAEVIGLGGELGSLSRGKQGDVVIWSGDPLEARQRGANGVDRRGSPAARKPPDQASRPLPRPRRARPCPRPIGGDRHRRASRSRPPRSSAPIC